MIGGSLSDPWSLVLVPARRHFLGSQEVTMANKEHLGILRQGVEAWNRWRTENPKVRPDLYHANLERADLSRANLRWAHLRGANLRQAILSEADLYEANLHGANLHGANLSGALLRWARLGEGNLAVACLDRADLSGASLVRADLSGANLVGAELGRAYLSGADLTRAKLMEATLFKAYLTGANLTEADLSGAVLTGTDLQGATLVQTRLSGATMTGCKVFGVSAWKLELADVKDQTNLLITPEDEPEITVDNLEVAQFIYLLTHNPKIREMMDTVTSKVVLILGRFSEERKHVLDRIRNELRRHNLVPVLFDFDKPASKDLTGTVETLARMARFIVADITDPSSIPHELATVIPFLPNTPIVPLRLRGSNGYGMFDDLHKRYERWVLPVYEYDDEVTLVAALAGEVIAPAARKAEELRDSNP
jgi:uncharacterized protein YjbI with pentapeptide repeats